MRASARSSAATRLHSAKLGPKTVALGFRSRSVRGMRRHSSLIPLSHDHHHALVQVRSLRRAAEGDTAAQRAATASFLRFFSDESVRHFRQEEERLFPALVDVAPAEEFLVQALLDHQCLHGLVARLDQDLSEGATDSALMREIADLLENHIRLEERSLFPLMEEIVPEALGRLDLAGQRAGAEAVADLLALLGRGPLWSIETDDLNATLLVWDAGEGPPEHVNAELDVLILVLSGSATVTINGDPYATQAGDAIVLMKGSSRRIVAGPHGVRYVSVHRRRAPLQIAAVASGAAPG
jgi:quercetin dioxygenase-like cupin family protein/hemerythrin-like domain-containing protein